MKKALPSSLVGWFLGYAEKLERPRLFKWICVLFLVDLLVIDPLPFIDEILLMLLTLYLARCKRESAAADAAQEQQSQTLKK
ncbi:hypothetical protein Maes01_02208 [Microbulbifer aestuariivivens]|uniref:DUF1232 domain-containing protein n=1 Tax=Microbulbifer aestuariivivens TaxID=1908308 RepID=A0ABP9WT45_9GAMM